MRSFTAMASWVGDVPADLLARADAGAGGQVPRRRPSKSTIWRALSAVDGVALEAAIGHWLTDQAYPADPDPGPAGTGPAHAIITNVGADRMTAAAVEAHHRLRGGIPEGTIRALKNDYGMIHAPVRQARATWRKGRSSGAGASPRPSNGSRTKTGST